MTDEEEKALKEKVESLEGMIEKATSETEGLQSLVGKWSSEIGDIRKQVKASGQDDELTKKLSAMETEIESLKSASPPQGGQPNEQAAPSVKPSERKSPEEQAAELETSLNDEQRKAVEAMYAEEEDKSKWDDPKFRIAVFQKVTAEVKSVPDSPWRAQKTEQPKLTDYERTVKELFAKTRKKATNIPPGSGGVGYRGPSEQAEEKKYTGGSVSSFLKGQPG